MQLYNRGVSIVMPDENALISAHFFKTTDAGLQVETRITLCWQWRQLLILSSRYLVEWGEVRGAGGAGEQGGITNLLGLDYLATWEVAF